MEIVWNGTNSKVMTHFKYRLTPARTLLFAVLLISGGWQIVTYGWEAIRPEEIWLGLVLLVALLGSAILRFYLGRRERSKTR
jgi:hypothetical protein